MKYTLQEDECGFTVLGDLIVPIKVGDHILFTFRFSALHMWFCFGNPSFFYGFYIPYFVLNMLLLTYDSADNCTRNYHFPLQLSVTMTSTTFKTNQKQQPEEKKENDTIEKEENKNEEGESRVKAGKISE